MVNLDIIKESLGFEKVLSENSLDIPFREEYLIPDTQPDVYDVLSVDTKVYVLNREVQSDRILLEYEVECNVMYLAREEEGLGINSVVYKEKNSSFIDIAGAEHSMMCDMECDLEHIDALDRELFNEHMYRLISGEEVTLPQFDFETSSRKVGKTVKLSKNQPIMIEGIHALNDDLTPSIQSAQKYRIYIAPQAQMHIDDQNPISISDIRLIRRMVRDHNYRNYDCEKTLSIWQSVRRGEFRWIYPHQEKADYVFNSELTYELCVMKKYALPLLEKITPDSPNYIAANRLIKFLKYFADIKDRWVPCNSILREFIGDSIFYTDDIN